MLGGREVERRENVRWKGGGKGGMGRERGGRGGMGERWNGREK